MTDPARKASRVLMKASDAEEWTEIGHIRTDFTAMPDGHEASEVTDAQIEAVPRNTITYTAELLNNNQREIERLFYGFDIVALRQTVAAWFQKYGACGLCCPAMFARAARKPEDGDA